MVMLRKSFLNIFQILWGKTVTTTTTTVDANLNHCLATERSLTGCLHFVNYTPIDSYSKGKHQWKLLHMDQPKTATEQIIDLRHILIYLGVPMKTESYPNGNKRSMVTSSTCPHSPLPKKHNILTYHLDRERNVSKFLAYHWIETGYNLSEVLSRHWDDPSVYNVIMNLQITRGPITLIPREATQDKLA